MQPTETPDDRVAQIRARAEAAHAEVHRLCEGARWTMQVPARPERDSDLVISAALGDIPYLLDQLAEAERNLASVHETMQDALRSNELIREMAAGFMAERDEARRQLAEAAALHQPMRDSNGEIADGQGWDESGDYTTFSPVCPTCGTSGEYAVPWPCATAAALGVQQ